MDHRLPCAKMKNTNFEGGIREILARADELARQGRSVIHLEIGRPDFDSPKAAKDAAIKALESGQVHYSDMAGTLELREAIAAKYEREWGMVLDPASEIVVSSGAVEALMTAFMTILSPGDEVIVPSPFFPIYDDQIQMSGGVLVNVPCSMKNDFRPQPDDIAAAITPHTRAILINSPNNPTGATSTRAELEGIAELAKKHDLFVISDECYEKFAYDPSTPHICMATLPGMRERTITISASSKTFSMTGWRIGWLLIPPAIRQYVMKCHQSLATCSNSFAQAGVAEALRSCSAEVEAMIAEYKARRDLMVSSLNAIDGIEVPVPNGAFYVFPSIKGTGIASYDFALGLLESKGVSTVPGQPFGAPDGFLRLTYCRPQDEIKEAMSRIAEFVKERSR